MADMRPFAPYVDDYKSTTSSTTTANMALARPLPPMTTLQLVNKSASYWAYFKWGSGSQTATVSHYPVAPGSKEVITTSGVVDNVAVILESGATSSTAYVIPGEGF